ncbi:autotransporter outer membrane beta-barrel domain-containing protein [uncultured Piscinibacter sp.]|uniref:autotransporter outer membrane beta-barrel domain-containing protein n=1 Tax=uncultured Piscinibacter sp. TaxID=1131835 RepID=UPI002623010C|nr:autotransporter outer membrane beta-barrel domain-containing protein [uncultured Piscinibacter sp.]
MNRKNTLRRTQALTPLALALLAAFPLWTQAATIECLTLGDCQGDQSEGIDIVAPPNTLNVFNLAGSGIRPVASKPGIQLTSQGGANLTVFSGLGGAPVSIVTLGADGIRVRSAGRPSGVTVDAFLDVPIPPSPFLPLPPGATPAAGGVVTVINHGNITTSGASAHGIEALSSTLGYASDVTAPLAAFDASRFSFAVTQVDGAAVSFGTAVPTRLAEITVAPNGQWTFSDSFGASHGTATFNADGTVDLVLDEAYFEQNLAAGQRQIVAVPIVIDGTRSDGATQPGLKGYVIVAYSKDADGVLTATKSTYFPAYGQSSRVATAERLPWPDLQGYVASLLATAEGAGGSGGSVAVEHRSGLILTQGAAAHGVLARSQGQGGAAGDNGGGFWTFGLDAPEAGQAGHAGGKAQVRVDGGITTTHKPPAGTVLDPDLGLAQASIGAFAHSAGGNGGKGGDGGTYYDGRKGGDGGAGGEVVVTGGGTILTEGRYGIGIYALSEGGNGGQGGSAEFVTDGAPGGAGGVGGKVTVDGSWNVTTLADDAHGIWAKSAAGTAGGGGSGGWAAGSPASGGAADDGGDVTLTSRGKVSTGGNDAMALFGQSVGGFGGSGGSGGSIFYSRGGSGSSAGSGGTVRVTNEAGGELATAGVASHALMAQSVGGGGGAGGTGAGIVALGGRGAEGGNGGDVFAVNRGTITTSGQDARGIYAQSVGGQGGDGGSATGIGAIGGAASGTSTGGDVDVTNDGRISTGGSGANAIFAQSIGGGGGSGGSSTGWFAVGGSGGGGGAAGTVTVRHGGSLLHTTQADASAIYAQSVGGGGGKGGNAVAVGTIAAVAIGGRGGAAGAASTVTVNTTAGEILTEGERSYGIFAQSIGGGGGSGGFAAATTVGVGAADFAFAVGGKAGGGGAAGEVQVDNASRIETKGEGAVGLFAESIGGGGGTGGFAFAGAFSAGVGVSLAMGGEGGIGGAGLKARVGNSGTIVTRGARAIGLQAQSVGGGGGNGGFSLSVAGGGIGAIGLGLGGSAGGGNAGGIVEVINSGGIDTSGAESHALFAQSVGGGGGNGGFNVSAAFGGTAAGSFGLGGKGGSGGDANTVTVENRGLLVTRGERAVGLFAQSVGGGGGDGGFSIGVSAGGAGAGTLNLGGSGDTGGDAAKVEVDNHGDIHTLKADAHGLFAQSLGGGGGNGGFSVAVSGAGTGSGSIGLGGAGSGGGEGRLVDVTQRGNIGTEGAGAVALFAQSLGGGGGNGGLSVSAAFGGTGAGTLDIGGNGAGGGAGGSVLVDHDGALTTLGRDAHGLFAQSVGGGGGNGGFSLALSAAGTGAGSIGIGGRAGGGGNGLDVNVTQRGLIHTAGDGAIGLFAQSVGGGGGNGGFSLALSGAGTGAGTIGIGGKGAGGGDGDAVWVDSAGEIVTAGARAHGLLAQSVGGGGGNGGLSIAASGGGKGAGSLSIGGAGAGGGNGKAVTVASGGSIDTFGEGAVGLFAQSVGGGGGNGGLAAAAAIGGSYALNLGFGGNAGQGGDGGAVQVDGTGAIVSRGDGAHAIQAQSIGGGGGNGGLAITLGINAPTGSGAEIGVTVGGQGGGGGLGSTVAVGRDDRALTGTLVTLGDSAHGIFAQSVGGGGGQGGSAVGLSFSADGKLDKKAKTVTANVTVAGTGGSGNIGGTVTVNNAATIDTVGGDSHGILAQSIGGGGGTGGGAKTIGLSTTGLLPLKDSEGTRLGLTVNVGGDGGSGNKGGLVTVVNEGAIQTRGAYSRGIFAQSVGGGGGAVSQGVLGTVGDWIDGAQNVLGGVALAKTLYDAFDQKDASGLIPSSLSITVGASEGSGADADKVRVENHADIGTLGFGAHGVFAQSIGAGGGDAKAYAEGRGGGESVGTAIGLLGEFVIGGAGGAAGSGGAVEVVHSGRIDTAGDQAHAIYAQSVGGGGGQAGSVAGGFSGIDAIGLGFGFGRNGGSAGNGAAVTVDSQGTLVTEGERSIGILAQSVGGGGGAAGDRSGLAFFGSVGGSGSGGDVTVTHDGAIVTGGARAHGIFAQSAGGSSSGAYAGRGGMVSVTLRGAGIAVSGTDADAILAQSIGVDGGRDIRVLIEGATVQGGAGGGAGVRFLDGADNLLDNRGAVTSLAGIDGLAVAGTVGGETVRNAGLIVGNVDLRSGANAFDNLAGAGLYSGTQLRLGSGNTLSNDGLLAPGGAGRRLTSVLDGDLVQGSQGQLDIDFDAMAAEADRIDVSGSARLDGELLLHVTNPVPADTQITLVSAAGGTASSGLTIESARSAVANYALVDTGTAVRLQYRIDFSDVAGLNDNQRRVGAHVNDIQSAGGTAEFSPLATALFALPEAEDLANAYDRLSPEPHGALATTSLLSSLQFSDSLLSCRVAEGEAHFVREGECDWLWAGMSTLRQDQTGDHLGFERKTFGVSGGFQRQIAAGWHAGGAAGIEHGIVHSDGLAGHRGDQWQAAGMLKHQRGGTTWSASLAGGSGRYQAWRAVDLPSGDVTARSTQRVNFLATHLRVGQLFDQGSWYLRPVADLGVTRVERRGFDESGAGAANLSVRAATQNFATLQPALEIGAESRRDDGSLLRPSLRVGVLRLLSGTSPQTQATLQGAPDSVAPFTVQGQIDRTLAEVSASLDLLDRSGTVLRLGYGGLFGPQLRRHTATLKVSMPF